MKLMMNDVFDLDDLATLTTIPDYYNHLSYDVSELIISHLATDDLPIQLEAKGERTNQTSFQLLASLEPLLQSVLPVNDNDSIQMMRSFSVQSEILLKEGISLNNFMSYKEAIKVLSEAIKYNSSNRETYIERAMAYFETNQITLALKDYEKARMLMFHPLKIQEIRNRELCIFPKMDSSLQKD